MGNRQKGRPTAAWELNAIKNIVDISREDLEDIYKDFLDVSKDYLLDKYEFRHMYQNLIHHARYQEYDTKKKHLILQRKNKKMADRIFKIFDKDRSGRLTFNEFIAIYIILQNSINPRVRLNFFLDHYSQCNNYISPNMAKRLIQDISILYRVNTDYQQIWRQIEADYGSYNGFVPKHAFIEYFLNHPAFSSAFYKTL